MIPAKRLVTLLIALSASASLAAAPAKVLVSPFDSAGPADKAWIAKAVQQNLVAELSRLNSVEAVVHEKPIADKAAALKAAQQAGADYVVLGAYQVNDADLRMTGQVIDVAKKETVAGLKATGTQRDLFGLEDVIASQVKRALPAPIANVPEMLPQPPAAGAVPAALPVAPAAARIPGFGPPVPGAVDPADLKRALARVDDLESRLAEALDRVRYNNDRYYDDYAYRPITYRYSPFGYGYGGGYGYGYGYVPQYNVAVIGGWNGRHSSGQFNIGTGSWAGAVPDGRNYSVPTGNYAVHPGNYVRPTGR